MILDPYSIREIQDEDLDEFIYIWNEHYNVLTTSKIQYKDNESKNQLLNWLHYNKINNERCYFGIFENTLLCGLLVLFPQKKLLEQIAIRKSKSNQKLGTQLIEFTKSQIDSNIKTEVLIENFQALNFFFKQGFSITEYIDAERDSYILAS